MPARCVRDAPLNRSRPAAVSVASAPRASVVHATRSTAPSATRRSISRVTPLLDSRTRSAMRFIRSRRSGAAAIWRSASYSASDRPWFAWSSSSRRRVMRAWARRNVRQVARRGSWASGACAGCAPGAADDGMACGDIRDILPARDIVDKTTIGRPALARGPPVACSGDHRRRADHDRAPGRRTRLTVAVDRGSTVDVVVVGGGIVGMAAAAELAGAGASVVLVERAEIGAGASGRNSGILWRPPDRVLDALYVETLAILRELAAERPAGPFHVPDQPVGILNLSHDQAGMRSRASELARSHPQYAP